MQNFVLHQTTKIIFGRETIAKIGPETAAFGKKVLLVYGSGSIKRNGIYRQVVESLVAAGLTVVEHGGVKSNPVLSHVRAGVALARREQVEVVVAVGGGSVIDSAKAIAAGALVEHDVWQFFKGKKSIGAKLPLTCVLTLAAAGSEMNGGMVLTNEEQQQKFGIGSQMLKPEVSILDPVATFTVPADYTAYGAIDAIAHLLEFYFTTGDPETPVQDRLAEGLIVNIMESCDRCLDNPADYEARASLMWCATLALNGLSAAGLGLVGFPMHMIEHSLSAIYDVPHGAGLSVVLPAWMSWRAPQAAARFAQFGRRVFNLTGTDEEAAVTGIAALKKWFIGVGGPVTLDELKIPASAVPALADNALALARLWRLRDYDAEKIAAILRLAR
jgi:hypothetical protein